MKDILLVLLIQLIYVPVFSLRTIFLVKGLRIQAAVFGLLESLIYIFGLSIVLNGSDNIAVPIVYATGFAIGILIGSKIEEALAIGYTTIQVNLPEKNVELITKLRDEGFGVTVYEGEGRDSKRFKLEILTKRSREEGLFELIEEFEPHAFIISYEPRKFQGGFLLKVMKKRKKKRNQ